MALETEVKVACSDPEGFRRKLTELGGELSAPRHFEDNFVLDFADGRLRQRGSLLRVRMAGGNAIITLKGPPMPAGLFKKRVETETSVGDGSVILGILLELGLQVWFRYQKYREEYDLTECGGAGRTLHVAIDETPIGNYLEIEGEEPAICRVAERLGIGTEHCLRDSYYALHVRYCERQGKVPGDMVFVQSEWFFP